MSIGKVDLVWIKNAASLQVPFYNIAVSVALIPFSMWASSLGLQLETHNRRAHIEGFTTKYIMVCVFTEMNIEWDLHNTKFYKKNTKPLSII